MKKNSFDYRGFYRNYDMSGEITIGTGTVKVHDIFDGLPGFMKKADCLFIDPPCSGGNLKSFYTKADKDFRQNINAFNDRLFQSVAEISPKHVFIEVFKSNKEAVISRLMEIYGNDIKTFPSYYYRNVENRCWILHASKEKSDFEIPFLDEEKAIEHICQNLDFQCIGDLCMGKGLVGFYANKYGKNFVGTELNEKRLACLIEHINQNKIIVR